MEFLSQLIEQLKTAVFSNPDIDSFWGDAPPITVLCVFPKRTQRYEA